ncbi:serine/threonine-protein kinase [Nocardiopsis sp. CNR-923]|uniref:serine/threonine protein kinase n=1 Tax=Nocardiopsis sp. CNR-923 TaxID=1904965 RepID=UPI00096A4931|nr:protein kinase [Nocardiopsis sp. CNR-923]
MELLGANDPREIGGYRLIAELGEGGMGRVLLAAGENGELVALKLVLPHLLRDEEFRYRFRREVLTSREAASGPYTAAVVDADEDARQPWLASEFFYGPTLAEVLDSHGPLDERATLYLARGLAAALAQIHGIEVLHRDIKPSNVLLTEDGVRLIDFGIARAPGTRGDITLTATGAMIGAPSYMSPEQITGAELTPKSDIFSLGTTLITAYTGTNPFDTDTPFQTMSKVVAAAPDLGAFPARLRGIIEPCLRTDPERRPTARALSELLGEVPRGDDLWPQGVRDLDRRQRSEVSALVRERGHTATVRASDKRVVFDLGDEASQEAGPREPAGQEKTPQEPADMEIEVPVGPFGNVLTTLKVPAGVAAAVLLAAVGFTALADDADREASSSSEDVSVTTPVTDDTDPPGASGGGSGLGTEEPEPEPEPDPIADAGVGDCFHDYGSANVPDLEPAPLCGSGTFEVVDVFHRTTDLDRCDDVDRVTTSVSSAANEMVLCLSYVHSFGEAYHAEPGECVFGPEDDSSPWNIVDCGTGVFQVLERIPREDDMDRCTESTYYNHAFSFTTSEDYLDVVLCLSMTYPSDIATPR